MGNLTIYTPRPVDNHKAVLHRVRSLEIRPDDSRQAVCVRYVYTLRPVDNHEGVLYRARSPEIRPCDFRLPVYK